MRFLPTRLPGVTVVEPDVYHDARGFFLETTTPVPIKRAESRRRLSRTIILNHRLVRSAGSTPRFGILKKADPSLGRRNF